VAVAAALACRFDDDLDGLALPVLDGKDPADGEAELEPREFGLGLDLALEAKEPGPALAAQGAAG